MKLTVSGWYSLSNKYLYIKAGKLTLTEVRLGHTTSEKNFYIGDIYRDL